jgi:hypothetical protein
MDEIKNKKAFCFSCQTKVTPMDAEILETKPSLTTRRRLSGKCQTCKLPVSTMLPSKQRRRKQSKKSNSEKKNVRK